MIVEFIVDFVQPSLKLVLTHFRIQILIFEYVICQDHINCAKYCHLEANKKCLWPLSHADKKSFEEKVKIRDLTVVNNHGIRAAALQVATRKESGD